MTFKTVAPVILSAKKNPARCVETHCLVQGHRLGDFAIVLVGSVLDYVVVSDIISPISNH